MRVTTIKIISIVAFFSTMHIGSHIVFAVEQSSTDSSNKGYIDSDYCKHLLNTDMYGWTSECSIQKGGSQHRLFDSRRTQYEDDGPNAVRSSNPRGNVTSTGTSALSIQNAKTKCTDLGFKLGTEDFGKCVLQLSK